MSDRAYRCPSLTLFGGSESRCGRKAGHAGMHVGPLDERAIMWEASPASVAGPEEYEWYDRDAIRELCGIDPEDPEYDEVWDE